MTMIRLSGDIFYTDGSMGHECLFEKCQRLYDRDSPCYAEENDLSPEEKEFVASLLKKEVHYFKSIYMVK